MTPNLPRNRHLIALAVMAMWVFAVVHLVVTKP